MFFPTSPSSGGGSSDSITESMTINIPSDFATPYDAVASFVGKVIAEGVVIRLQLAPGVLEIPTEESFAVLGVDLTKFEMHGEPAQWYLINATGAAVVLNEGEGGGYYVSLGIADITGLEVGDLICLNEPQANQEFGVHYRELCGMAVITSLEAADSESGITALFPNVLVSEGTLVTFGAITKFKTVIDFQGFTGYSYEKSTFSKISNIGHKTSTGCFVGMTIRNGCNLSVENMSGTGFITVGFYGFNTNGLIVGSNSTLYGDLAIGGCRGQSGLSVYTKSFYSGKIFANGNGSGIECLDNSIATLSTSYLSGNQYVGVSAYNSSRISSMTNEIVIKNNTILDINCYIDSVINIDSATHSFTDFDTTVPAINTAGSFNSLINVI